MHPTIDVHDPRTCVSESSSDADCRLRESDPVHRVDTPNGDAWMFTKYDDLVRACREPEDFSSAQGAEPPDLLLEEYDELVP